MSAFGDFISKSSSSLGNVGSSVINGLFSLLGQRKQFKYQKQLNEQQQEMALEQMQQSQDYNLANMATQNQYAIDAEKRAQEWNDIGAQASRARAAGISPLAALGSSSGGVLSQSSAPSSTTPSPTGANAGGVGSVGSLGLNLGASIIQDKQLRIEEQRVENERLMAEAQARKTNAEAFEQEFNNDILPILKAYELDDAQTQAVKNAYERIYYADGENSIAYKDAIADLDNKLKDNKVKDNIIDELKQKVEESKSRQRLNESEADYQDLVNQKFRDYGVTPNGGMSGLALGLTTSLINALGGNSQSASDVVDKVVSWIYKDSPLDRMINFSRKVDKFIADKFASISSEKRAEIVETISRHMEKMD